MSNSNQVLTTPRPAILIRAARLAQRRYNRAKMLSRWLLSGSQLSPSEALNDFSEMEQEVNEQRLSGSFDYRVEDHIELLAAVLFEWSLAQSPYPNASGSDALRSAM